MKEEEKKAVNTEPEKAQEPAETAEPEKPAEETPAEPEKQEPAAEEPEGTAAAEETPAENSRPDEEPEKTEEPKESDTIEEPDTAEEPSAPSSAEKKEQEQPAEPAEPSAPTEPEKSLQPQEKTPGNTTKKRRLPLWARVVLGILCVVVIFLGLAVAYVNGKLDLIRYDDGTVDFMGSIGADEDQDLDSSGLEHNTGDMVMPEGSPFQDDNVLNILLISTDERTDAVNDADAFTHLNELDGTDDTTEFSDDARADSLIVASLNIQEDTIKLVSIERATGVPIMLDGYEDQYDWITHTFRYGGARLTMDTVSECLNLDVDHYVRFNFNSFVQIVDAVGGIDIELTEMEAAALNWEVPSNSMLIVGKVHAGLNHLDGYTALQYARLRAIDNDWQRIVRQRTVIQAVLDQIQHASVTELDDLLNTVLPLVQTNFTKSEITALLVQLPGFLGVQTEQMSLPVEGTYGVRTGMDDRVMYDPDWQTNSDILQDFFYNDMTAEEAIAAHVEQPAATGESAQTTEAENLTPEQSYLTANSSPVDLEEGINSEDFGNGNYRVFLAGAPENTAQTWQMKKALVQYLHEGQGVNVLLEDCGPAAALALQQYIDTGSGVSFQSEEEAEYWDWLFQYNDSQLDSGKFTIVGLGGDDDADLALTGLTTLLDEEVTAEDLTTTAARNLLTNMRAGNAVRTNSSYRLLYRLQWLSEGSAAEQADLSLMFGENTDHVLELLADVLAGTSGKDGMAANFENAWQQYSDQNFFGMFDPEQILLAPADLNGDGEMPQTTLAMAINTGTTPAAGKVCAILGACVDVAGEGPQPQAVDARTLYDTLSDADALAASLEAEATAAPEASLEPDTEPTPEPTDVWEEGEDPESTEEPEDTGSAYFLALDGKDSPYAENNGILSDDAQASSLPAAEYFQKILLVPSAETCTPVSEAAERTDGGVR